MRHSRSVPVPRRSVGQAQRLTAKVSPNPSLKASEAVQSWDILLIAMAVFISIAMARLHVFVPGMNAIRPGLIIAGVAIAAALGNMKGPRSPMRLGHPLGYLMLFFVVWAAIGAPFALVKGRAAAFLLEHFFRTGVLVILIAMCVRNFHDVRRLAMVLAAGGMLFAYFAVLPGSFRRVGGGGYDANDSAMLMAMTLPLIVHFLLRERRLALRIFFAVAAVLCVVGIVRTGSRGGFLAFGMVLIYMVFFLGGVKAIWRYLTVGAIAAVMMFSATSEYWDTMQSITDPEDYNYTSTTGRKAIWERSRGYMLQNPVFGAGIDNFASMEGRSEAAQRRLASGRGFKWSAPHSQWYQVGVELGFPGLLAFMGMFLVAGLHLRRIVVRGRSRLNDPILREAAGLSSALIGSLIVIAVAGSFLSHAYSPMVWGLFGLILGLFKAMRIHDSAVNLQAHNSSGGLRSSTSGTSKRRRSARFVYNESERQIY